MLETSNISAINNSINVNSITGSHNNEVTSSFENIIQDELKQQETEKLPKTGTDVSTICEMDIILQNERSAFETKTAYIEAGKANSSLTIKEQLIKYKEDQLLSKPGGDYFNLKKGTDVIDYKKDQSGFTVRVGKDIKDAGENFVNVFKDIGFGAEIRYVDRDGHFQEGRKTGFIATIVNFFKDMASGITFGKYNPNGEKSPDNAIEATKHFFKKIFVDAVFKDIVVGIPRSVIHVGEDAVFTCINAAETIPDATVGNFKAGQAATTEIFDDMQVFVDFVTDVLPMGEAGARTHAFSFDKGLKGLPIVYNITAPEQGRSEDDWKYVRNTPFRKAIESVATLIPMRM